MKGITVKKEKQG